MMLLVIAMTCMSPVNYKNKGHRFWLTWAGTEARPTKRGALPETGNLIFSVIAMTYKSHPRTMKIKSAKGGQCPPYKVGRQ